MKKFFIGVGLGLLLEIGFPLGMRSVVVFFKGSIGDDAAYFSTYPFWGTVLLFVYFMAAKRNYKISVGIFAGFIVGFVIWGLLLAGV